MNLEDTKILSTSQAQHWLVDTASFQVSQIDFCSAYVKESSLKFFYSNYLLNGYSGATRLMARWKPLDLISGASDLEVYEYCKLHGIKLFIKNDFHGKLYQVKPTGLLIGSFNLTNSGFGLHQNSNDEAGVIIDISVKNSDYIDELFLDATEVTDSLYIKIKEFLSNSKNTQNNAVLDWSEEVKDLLAPPKIPSGLLVSEFFYSTPINRNNEGAWHEHDLSLLGLSKADMEAEAPIKSAFRRSIPYIWLKKILIDNNGEMYFGGITKQLHDCLIDDPTPYRKDVKKLVQNLFSWIDRYGADDFIIDQLNHSQRIRLNNVSL
jgi:hypothetical protein